MRITKQAIKDLNRVISNSKRGYDWEASAIIRWAVSSKGNIIFEGWNAPRGTFYNEINCGFIVDWSCENQRYEVLTSGSYRTEDFTQEILEQIAGIEQDAQEDIY